MDSLNGKKPFSFCFDNSKSIFLAKLNEDALQNLEECKRNEASTAYKPYIQFKGDKGIVTLNDKNGRLQSYDFSLSPTHVAYQGSFQCMEKSEEGELISLGNVVTEMKFHVKEESIGNTTSEIEAVDQEQKTHGPNEVSISSASQAATTQGHHSQENVSPFERKKSKSILKQVLLKNITRRATAIIRTASEESIETPNPPTDPASAPLSQSAVPESCKEKKKKHVAEESENYRDPRAKKKRISHYKKISGEGVLSVNMNKINTPRTEPPTLPCGNLLAAQEKVKKRKREVSSDNYSNPRKSVRDSRRPENKRTGYKCSSSAEITMLNKTVTASQVTSCQSTGYKYSSSAEITLLNKTATASQVTSNQSTGYKCSSSAKIAMLNKTATASQVTSNQSTGYKCSSSAKIAMLNKTATASQVTSNQSTGYKCSSSAKITMLNKAATASQVTSNQSTGYKCSSSAKITMLNKTATASQVTSNQSTGYKCSSSAEITMLNKTATASQVTSNQSTDYKCSSSAEITMLNKTATASQVTSNQSTGYTCSSSAEIKRLDKTDTVIQVTSNQNAANSSTSPANTVMNNMLNFQEIETIEDREECRGVYATLLEEFNQLDADDKTCLQYMRSLVRTAAIYPEGSSAYKEVVAMYSNTLIHHERRYQRLLTLSDQLSCLYNLIRCFDSKIRATLL